MESALSEVEKRRLARTLQDNVVEIQVGPLSHLRPRQERLPAGLRNPLQHRIGLIGGIAGEVEPCHQVVEQTARVDDDSDMRRLHDLQVLAIQRHPPGLDGLEPEATRVVSAGASKPYK